MPCTSSSTAFFVFLPSKKERNTTKEGLLLPPFLPLPLTAGGHHQNRVPPLVNSYHLWCCFVLLFIIYFIFDRPPPGGSPPRWRAPDKRRRDEHVCSECRRTPRNMRPTVHGTTSILKCRPISAHSPDRRCVLYRRSQNRDSSEPRRDERHLCRAERSGPVVMRCSRKVRRASRARSVRASESIGFDLRSKIPGTYDAVLRRRAIILSQNLAFKFVATKGDRDEQL